MEFSHLEKMGRELKCPICLSLLKSAAMLNCNHVFCNSCIVESMKSRSSCPVCKLPFRRREVRPALHMDNLVSIYQNMEAASGLTLFTSQVALPNNNEELQVADNKKSNAQKSIMVTHENARAKRSSKGKRKKMERLGSKTSDPCSSRPSCSSNKRIHVTPYPVAETPVQQKRTNRSVISATEVMHTSKFEDNKVLAHKGVDPILPPLFWLCEANEDDEGKERMTTQELSSLVTPKSVPCFSDIKDSDDASTPKNATPISKSVAQQAFDSEMFEWTQRACSPELFSTPVKQSAVGGSFNRHTEDKPREIYGSLSMCSRHLESPKACHLLKNAKTTRTVYTRKGTLRKKCKQNKEKNRTDEMTSISLNEERPFGSNEIVHDSSQEKESSKKVNTLRYTKKVDKKRHKAVTGKRIIIHPKNCMTRRLREINGLADVHRVIPAKSPQGIQNHGIESTSRMLPDISPDKFMDIVAVSQKECQKRSKKTAFISIEQTERLPSNLSELKASDANLLGNPTKDRPPSIEFGNTNSRLQLLSSKHDEDSDRRNVRIDPKIKMDVKKHDQQKRLKMENVDNLAAMTSQKKQHTSTTVAFKEDSQSSMDLQKSSSKKLLSHLTKDEVLRKCKTVHLPVECAFCHSSKFLEVSGEIVHYFNGKSVSSDYNGGVNVIHCHRSCTEWAPDVFFKDDMAINLSAELSRSRRIACSCCGIKGAALGCFEKSCRRSFHYPCAKQTPECRWDNENFVMLCPLHSSSKFPSETSDLQKQKRKASGSKSLREVQPTSQPVDSDKGICKWSWPSRLPCKWVLCSSALSGAEKEILSEFASLTGIPVSITWSSVVTHVIASTDENGACKRTLKFLMGILEGKWILSIEWIKACMKFMKPVDEEKYEISVDVHGICDGPHLGRMRKVNKEPKIFSSFCFYFCGDFVASYKGYLHDLITAGGGKVLQRRPVSTELRKLDDSSSITFIVYSLELSDNLCNLGGKEVESRKAESMALAQTCGAKVVANSWIIDSIAASKLQVLPV